MNITPQNNFTPVATVVNPSTDNLRRENATREVISQPAAASQSAAEKGVGSQKDREKAKSSSQDNQNLDYTDIRKQSNASDVAINGSAKDEDGSDDNRNNSAQQNDENNTNKAEENEKSNIEEFADNQEIYKLQQREREVRTHELAHATVGGASTGAPSYTYKEGPDGKRYVVDGEVSVDLSIVKGNPRATITKMQEVYAAALAPARPSVQDTRVAASAAKIIAQAQSQILNEELDKLNNQSSPAPVQQTNQTLKHEATEQETASSEQGNRKSPEKIATSFDTQIGQTLKSSGVQEEITSSSTKLEVSHEVQLRSARISALYSSITHAYEEPDNNKLQLTA